jgi:hypothetical protein
MLCTWLSAATAAAAAAAVLVAHQHRWLQCTRQFVQQASLTQVVEAHALHVAFSSSSSSARGAPAQAAAVHRAVCAEQASLTRVVEAHALHVVCRNSSEGGVVSTKCTGTHFINILLFVSCPATAGSMRRAASRCSAQQAGALAGPTTQRCVACARPLATPATWLRSLASLALCGSRDTAAMGWRM